MMDTEILKTIGLTDLQVKIYLYLLEHGQQTPTEIATALGENRTTVYSATEKLATLQIITQKAKGKITAYAPTNPTTLKSYILAKQKNLRNASIQLDSVLPILLSRFRLTSDQPGITTIEGVDGIKLVYDEILRTQKEVLIFASPHDRTSPAISTFIDHQIQKQIQAAIPVKSLVQKPYYKTHKHTQSDLLALRPYPSDNHLFDAQIMVFGDIAVFTIFNDDIINTIYNSPQAAATLRSAFFAIWNSASE